MLVLGGLDNVVGNIQQQEPFGMGTLSKFMFPSQQHFVQARRLNVYVFKNMFGESIDTYLRRFQRMESLAQRCLTVHRLRGSVTRKMVVAAVFELFKTNANKQKMAPRVLLW